MLKHAKLSPSAAARWMTCPGSVALTADMPDTTTIYAQEGTKAHDLAEQCLSQKVDALHFAGEDYDESMLMYVQSYLDYVRTLKHKSSRLYVEKRLSLQKWVPGGFGTCDAILLDKRKRQLHIIDLKYGMNKVDVENNSQLYMYALGAVDKVLEHIDSVTIHIVQPRINYYGSEEIPLDKLHAFGVKAKKAANLCFTDNAPLNPSEKACEWCKAKATCPALYEHSLKVVGDDFTPIAVEKMTDAQLKLVLDNKTLIDKWLKSVESHIMGKLTSGETFAGYKLVEGRSIRKYTADAENILSKMLGDTAYQNKLIGITDAEKLIGKKQFSELNITQKPPGKPTIVADTDKRPAITSTLDDFNNL